MSVAPEVTVVGSLNLDLMVRVGHIPGAGETVLGGDLRRVPGGKGANQAVATARLGRRVAMVGRVGDDAAGDQLAAALVEAGVDVAGVRVTPGVASGVALIAVEPGGDNAIVVAPGANGRLGRDDVRSEAVAAAAVVLVQLEVPLGAVEAAVAHAGGLVVCNPAPAPETPLPADLLRDVDVLVPNQGELCRLAGIASTDDLDRLAAAARVLGPAAVVVTLGARGALVVDGSGAHHVPAPAVHPVDTTAAGDAFCAGLADLLVEGRPLREAVRWAVRVGAAATLRAGAQPSLPTRAEVERATEPAPGRPQDR